MNRIIEIDEENMMAVVEPGVIVGNLHREVEKRMLFYPPDPASLDSCSIGGNVAENAGGPRAVKYGITRSYVTGLEVVLPTGEVVNYGGKLVKNVAGYDLAHFFIGTEGTLGIVTKIVLRLIPLPRHRIDLLVPFPTHESAALTVSEVMRDKGIVPVVLEFMDLACVLAVEKLLERELPFREAAAQLIIGLDGPDADQLLTEAEAIGEICLRNGAEDVLVADTEPTRNRLWEARRVAYEALKAQAEQVELEDLCVPRTRIPEVMTAIKEASELYGLPLGVVGHAGDGNVHVVLMKQGIDEETWRDKVDKTNNRILSAAVRLGGSIAGEHGVGLLKKRFMPLSVGEAELTVMRKLKEALDPNGILNPGKIFPGE
jgi:glycolate oxidase